MRSTEPRFRLRMLGGLQLTESGGCVEGRATQRKRLLLLALLATSERGMTRAKLASLLWPERGEERARKALSDALYVLRSELGDTVVLTSGDDVELGSTVDTDVFRFERAAERGDLDEALGLYRGPFLDGVRLPESDVLERWAEIERERLADVHSRSLERAALDAGDRGEWREAVGWWRRLSAREPYNSRVVASLMDALARSGAPAEALREGRAHELRLRDELGVEPDPVVRETAERLREDEAVPGTVAPAGGTTSRVDRRRWVWGATAAVVLGIVALLAYDRATSSSVSGTSGSIGDAPHPRSIAVLPFEHLGTEPADRRFARGMHTAILTDLANLGDLVVSSRTSVLGFESPTRDLREVGRELGVAYVLEGTVQHSGARVRVSARLTDTETGKTVWAERLDRDYAPHAVFDLQSEIAREVASALEASLSSRERKRLALRPTGNLTAYDLYLRGQEHLAHPSPDGVEDAIRAFRAALREDPEFALAHAGLAMAYRDRSELTGSAEWLDSMPVLARRALRFDPDLPEAHLALAEYYARTGRRERSLREARRVLEVRPNDAWATFWLSSYYHAQGDLVQGVCWAERALELEPTESRHYRTMSLARNAVGDFRAGEDAARRGLKIEPDDVSLYEPLVLATMARGDRRAAMRAYRTARSLASLESGDQQHLATIEIMLGMADSARRRLEHLRSEHSGPLHPWTIALAEASWRTNHRDRAVRLLEQRERLERSALARREAGFFPLLNLARIHAVREDVPAALDWLEETLDRGGYLHPRILLPTVDSPFRELREDPRFRRLVERGWDRIDVARHRLDEEGCRTLRRLPEG